MANAFTYSAPVSPDNTGTDLFTDRLMNFLDSSPVSFLAAHNIAQHLTAAGFSLCGRRMPGSFCPADAIM